MAAVVNYTFNIEDALLKKFRNKVITEGFTVQDGFTLLIQNYVEGRFDIDGNMYGNRQSS